MEERRELRKAPATVEKVRGEAEDKMCLPTAGRVSQMQACRLTAPRGSGRPAVCSPDSAPLLRSQFLRTRPHLHLMGAVQPGSRYLSRPSTPINFNTRLLHRIFPSGSCRHTLSSGHPGFDYASPSIKPFHAFIWSFLFFKTEFSLSRSTSPFLTSFPNSSSLFHGTWV